MMSDEKLLDFCRALEAAVRSGLALSDAFSTLSRSPAYGRLAAAAAEQVARGRTLHKALGDLGVFPPVFLALLRAGEEGGKTDEFLKIYADCLEVRVEFRRRLVRALVYPGLVVLAAVILFLALSFKALPLILEPLAGAGGGVPEAALRLQALAAGLYARWPEALGAAGLLFVLLRAALRSGPGRKTRALACRLLPGLRYATSEAGFHNIFTTMSLLLKAGLPPSAMMEVLLQFAEDDPPARRLFERASALLAGGVTFTAAFEGFVPAEDSVALDMGERTGRLEETLQRLGKLHYDRHQHRLKVISVLFTVGAAAALAPLCLLLLLSLAQAVFSALGAAAVPSAGSQAPAVAAPAPRALPEEEDSSAASAGFNAAQGAKIADFMRQRGVREQEPGTAPAAAEAGAAGPAGPAASEKKKLTPPPAMRRAAFGGVRSTEIRPTDLSGGR